MANIEAARKDIQKVVAFLVSRFGSEAEVFAHLSSALAHLREEPPVSSTSGTDATVVVVPEAVTGTTTPTKKAEPRPSARKRMGKGK